MKPLSLHPLFAFAGLLAFASLGMAQGAMPGVGAGGPTTDDAGLAQSSGYAQVTADLRVAEYRYSTVADHDGVWSAPNRSQGLHSRVSAAGIEVSPSLTRTEGDDAAWKLELGTRTFGRRDLAQKVGPGSAASEGARAEIAYGVISEWFENRPEGIEQGWTIASPPSGFEPVWIGLSIGGDLFLRKRPGGAWGPGLTA